MKNTKVFLYCRVAHDDGFSLQAQETGLRRYAKQSEYDIVVASCEYGGGLTLDRTAFKRSHRPFLMERWSLFL